MSIISQHCYVSGRVQGVWYRSGAQKKARALGLTGWVKNTDDGRVALLVCGDETRVAALVQWLWKGPLFARVTDVSIEAANEESLQDFEIR